MTDPTAATVIDRFTVSGPQGYQHSPLSNFHLGDLLISNQIWASMEAYYQGMKTLITEEREAIRLAPTPGEAKKLGRRCHLRPNWEEIKLPVMRFGLRHKFVPANSEGTYLLNTGDALLIEGNDWGDKFWGCVDGLGENWLGMLLMGRRAELRYLAATGSVAFMRIEG